MGLIAVRDTIQNKLAGTRAYPRCIPDELSNVSVAKEGPKPQCEKERTIVER